MNVRHPLSVQSRKVVSFSGIDKILYEKISSFFVVANHTPGPSL